MWQLWDAYRKGQGPCPEPTADSWSVPVDEIKARDYDLSARNPNRNEQAQIPHPAELTARLLERVRELHSILENLHEMVSNANREDQ